MNQDVALEDHDLFAVADGMGGAVGGDVAARTAISALREAFRSEATVEGLRNAIAEANRAVWRMGQEEIRLQGMGTTLTATALVQGPDGQQVIALANVGDSRAYVFSRGQVLQVTVDHSLVEEKVRLGELTEAEAAVHPHRHILTRVLGVNRDVDVDLWELHLKHGDRILLCSDGLTNEIADDKIRSILAAFSDPREAAAALVKAALDHGGNDNVTVVVVDVDGFESPAQPVVVASVAETGGDVSSVSMPEGSTDRPREEGGPRRISSNVATSQIATRTGGAESGGTSSAPGPTTDDTDAADDDIGSISVLSDRQPSRSRSQVRVLGPHDDLYSGRETGLQTGPGTADGGVVAFPTSAKLIGSASRPVPLTPATSPGIHAAELRRWQPSRTGRRRRRRGAGGTRLITLRVVAFFVLVVAIVVAAYALVRWYATDDWYVGLDHQHLAVYQGRPGGVLWFHPKMVFLSHVTTKDVPSFTLHDLQQGRQESSLNAARRYVTNLHQEFLDTHKKTTISSSSSHSTSPSSTSSTSGTPGAASLVSRSFAGVFQ